MVDRCHVTCPAGEQWLVVIGQQDLGGSMCVCVFLYKKQCNERPKNDATFVISKGNNDRKKAIPNTRANIAQQKTTQGLWKGNFTTTTTLRLLKPKLSL